MKKSLLYTAMLVALPILGGCNSSSSDNQNPSDGIYDREGEIAEFYANPYLQHPTDNGMTVMFEPIVKEGNSAESIVYYREQGQTGPYTPMTTVSSDYDELDLVQRARIEALKSDTKYDYFVRSPAGDSKVYNFRTWPNSSDLEKHAEYRFIAMSDTHASDRDRFGEGLTGLRDIYEHGIIKHECLDDVALCNDLLAGVLVAGDLVYASNARKAYRDFFESSHELASYLPILPTPGNHEYDGGNIEAYDIYLDWPEQMGWDKARYTYSLDFLNLRMFFFNSFVQSDGAQEYQYDWTMDELNDTANNADVDYVLGITHAPCKSSMWLSGESQKSCDFVGLLHDYSEETGKLSSHIFGHTHAYTRGNEMDVPHVGLNVATSVGRIDHFAEFAQKDYDTVAVSNDDNGYNIMTFTADGAKTITITRRSGGSFYRGFQMDFPELETVVMHVNDGPTTPAIETFEVIDSGEISIAATEFNAREDSEHYETQWQLSPNADFSEDLTNIWGNTTRAYNWWYNEEDMFDDEGNRITECNPYADKDDTVNDCVHTVAIDTQEGVDITQYQTVVEIAPGQDIHARVRYRDKQLNWSDWSESSSIFFDGVATDNLVINGGAETGTTEGWTHYPKTDDQTENALVTLEKGDCGVQDVIGTRVFQLGNLEGCNGHGYGFGGVAYQTVDAFEALEGYTGAEPLYVNYSSYMMNWNNSNDDPIWMYVAFLDSNESIIEESEHIKADSPKKLTKYSGATLAPAGTQYVRIVMESEHQSGTDTDSQFDDVELILSMPN
ncbi:metallophosphoesterase family protein [Vibrio sp. FNV 38]|nr:metallophosphoesterase family protein [Vibrio sp. FNV 38]